MNAAALVLGFDVGLKRVGVATGQRITGTARAVSVVAHRAGTPDWPALDRVVADYRPGAVVVGLPRHADGAEHAVTAAARAFAAQAGARWQVPVHLVDEALSSVAAERRLAAQGVRGRNVQARRDAEAAAVILETWLGDARQA